MQPTEHPARKIKFLLRTGNATIHDLSDKVGITIESLRDILDEREMPTANLLYRICNFFGVKENFFEECLRPAPKPGSVREGAKANSSTPAPASSVPDLFPRPPASARGPDERRKGGKKLRPHRKLDFAELAARQSVLVELLISKGVFTKDEFETRMEILRARVLARKQSVQKSR